MGSIFNGINIGLKSLQVQKKAMDTTGHNIANAGTEGYSRQRAVQKTTEPYTEPGLNMPAGAGQMGTGVKIDEIERIRDQFIDGQIQEKKQNQGYWEKRYDGLHRIELIFNEPSENSLNAAMNNFWSSLEDLSNNPENTAVRTTVRERAVTLADSFHSLDDQLEDYKRSLNRDVRTTVNDINSLSGRIADLNQQIVHIKSSGQQPNDLMDNRDLLLEKMNKLINLQSNYDDRGNLNISIGGRSLVAGANSKELAAEPVAGKDYEYQILFGEVKSEITPDRGELAGLINIRDEEISAYREELDEMAKEFTDKFNEVHEEGYDLNGDDAGEFFVQLTDTEGAAAKIAVAIEDINKIAAGRFAGDYSNNSDIMTAAVTDVNNVENGNQYQVTIDDSDDSYTIENITTGTVIDSGGAGSFTPGMTVNDTANSGLEFTLNDYGTATAEMEPAPGNGYNALELADVIKNEKLFDSGQTTVQDKYEAIISSLGVDGQRADQMVDNQDVLVNQLENQRQSISGVSLDEEMSNMIKYQQAYNATSKFISSYNRVLDSLMSILR